MEILGRFSVVIQIKEHGYGFRLLKKNPLSPKNKKVRDDVSTVRVYIETAVK